MALPQSFSRRKRMAQGSDQDVYFYDPIPENIRTTFLLVIEENLDSGDASRSGNLQDMIGVINNNIAKDKGVFELSHGHNRSNWSVFKSWFMNETYTDYVVDGMEWLLRLFDRLIRDERSSYGYRYDFDVDRVLSETNARFKESGLGYQYVDGEIIRVDSEFIHSEAVVPVLSLVSAPQFQTVDREFRSAHAAYRAREFETCITECAKAFESTLKIIGESRGWPIKENDTAKKLLDAAYAADFLPSYLETEFTGIRTMLEGSVPVVRNKSAAHGAGSTPRQVPEHLATFQLQQTAVAILFLIKHHQQPGN